MQNTSLNSLSFQFPTSQECPSQPQPQNQSNEMKVNDQTDNLNKDSNEIIWFDNFRHQPPQIPFPSPLLDNIQKLEPTEPVKIDSFVPQYSGLGYLPNPSISSPSISIPNSQIQGLSLSFSFQSNSSTYTAIIQPVNPLNLVKPELIKLNTTDNTINKQVNPMNKDDEELLPFTPLFNNIKGNTHPTKCQSTDLELNVFNKDINLIPISEYKHDHDNSKEGLKRSLVEEEEIIQFDKQTFGIKSKRNDNDIGTGFKDLMNRAGKMAVKRRLNP